MGRNMIDLAIRSYRTRSSSTAKVNPMETLSMVKKITHSALFRKAMTMLGLVKA